MSNAIAKQIWSGFTNPSQIDQSGVFSGCDFLVLNAFGVGSDNFEIAAAVAIEVSADTLYLNGAVQVPQAPLGSKEIPLNITGFDTALIVPLPSEATRSDCECRIYLATSYAVNLEIFAVSKKSLCDCKLELDAIKSELDYLRLVNSAIAVNQLSQNTAVVLMATSVGVALAPFTGNASLALPSGVTSAIAPGSSALLALSGLVLP